jgi:integrase
VEFARLGAAIREAETIGIEWTVDASKPTSKHVPKQPENRRSIISPHAAAALRLLLFTGARLREILHLRWEHVDLSRGMLFLPDSKTGRKTIVLSSAAVAIFQELAKPNLKVSEFVIAGDDPERPRSDLKRPWALVSARAKLKGVRLHDLRHSFASIGAGSGMGLPLLGKLLGHADAATTARYAHLDADPLKRATDAIGAMISEAMSRDDI